MNQPESRLQRLVAAARTAPAEPAEAMPNHLKTRILAHWRTHAEDHARLWMSLLCRRALVCAAIIMAASVAWSVATDEPDDEVTLATYELRADLLP